MRTALTVTVSFAQAEIDYSLRLLDFADIQMDDPMERWYLATLLALVLHQIDAAFWQEWALFGVPGGIQGFLAFNLIAVGALLHGYRQVVLAKPSARAYASLCGTVGAGTAMIHVGLAAAGRNEFLLPLSIATLAACLVAGVGLLMQGRRATPARVQIDGVD